jgi:hypothetical protein
MPQLPTPFRAVIGLAATAMEEAKHLPDKAIELPMLAVSTALQLSLRAQQRYAHFAAVGDEVLNRREPTDEPPPWATFDDDIPGDPNRPLADLDGALDEAEELPSPRKTVRRPRNAAPSAFDAVADD